jgi:uncharacterized membrane protein YcaP (DUF421 family)
MDVQELLLTAARATVIYFVMLIVVRLLGKRSIGALSAFDLLVALMLGEVVDEIIYGDVTMVQGLLVIVIIAAWHFVNEWASFKSKFIARLTESEPTVLIKDGVIQEMSLERERFSKDELFSQLRLQSIEDPQEVKLAQLEPSGHVSVIKVESARPLEKQDLKRAGLIDKPKTS